MHQIDIFFVVVGQFVVIGQRLDLTLRHRHWLVRLAQVVRGRLRQTLGLEGSLVDTRLRVRALHDRASRHPGHGRGHLLKIAPILHVLIEFLVHLALVNNSLAVKESLSEGMVLALDPIRLFLARNEV